MLAADDPLAVAATQAVQTGDLEALGRLLAEHPDLATARIGDPDGMSRTLLHAATDWPGHYPNNAATVRALVAAGGDVDARFAGPHRETPLHWAASSDDVEVIDALLDAGANIEADGAVIAGGTPLTDAVAFAQWNAARRLVERGAHVPMREAAALGMLDRLDELCAADPATVGRRPDPGPLVRLPRRSAGDGRAPPGPGSGPELGLDVGRADAPRCRPPQRSR